MDRKDALRIQIRETEHHIKRWQALGVLTSAVVFILFVIGGFKNPLVYTFTLVPYIGSSLASVPLMIELNRLCKELTGKN